MDRAEFLQRCAGAVAVAAFPRLARANAPLSALARAVRGPVLLPGSAAYDRARRVFDASYSSTRPLAVVQPIDARDVSAVVRWARRHGVRIVAKSGGHSYGGYSTTTGVVVDLSRLAGVSIEGGSAVVGAGTRLGALYQALGSRGLAIPAGSCPSVGIGGHVLGGGFGLASRAWGLASDNLVRLSVVAADGDVLVADADRHADLYWACRGGGGGNFGIATGFVFRTHRVDEGAYFIASWPWQQADEVVQSFLAWAPHQPDALGALCRLATGTAGPTVQVFGQFLGTEAALRSALASLGPPATRLTIGSESWLDLVQRWAGCVAHTLPQCSAPITQSFVGSSDYLARVPTPAQVATFTAAIEARGSDVGSLLVDAYGGAVNRVAPSATAFVHRRQLASIQYVAIGEPHAARAWVDETRSELRGAVSGEAYVNYIDPHLRDWRRAYYGANLPRLRAVKKRYDPHDVFRFAQGV
jgi:FAD/FMN-containing dehydrogenase